MPNVTIALNERLLTASREYAQRHGTSLNALIRECLEQKVSAPKPQPLKTKEGGKR
jgi:predicted HicB family RNase H-like nuclease